MKILLVYPKHPETFWSFKHALKFIGKKSVFPPLGLLTVASMLPVNWDKKMIDMNVDNLSDQEVESVLIKLYSLCERVVDKTIEEKYGKS